MKSNFILQAGVGDAICMRHSDVNSAHSDFITAVQPRSVSTPNPATIVDAPTGKRVGLTGDHRQLSYTDGNPSETGRVFAALLCGLGNGHGDCIHDSVTNNVTCACVDGYSGQFCALAPSSAEIILMLIIALLFLLLTLLCCLYLCARCRCFGGRGVSQSSASGREILGSDYYTIPRAKLKPRAAYGDKMMSDDNAAVLGAYLDDGASISSDGSLEEVERQVTTT
ncbi:unnamed protein product [Heligmosomoides polygyrus]|uniref:EGF-like domain-containing protein n=1 Tax=Heligmosomoides polygyrus TaxID=6339 RepID=A0A183G9M4_HELPZ|nr:unnamed protein product [Heligmosomoides polygyrus]